MKEKNNVFLMIIAVVALIATVGGATYAYFASSITEGEGLNLDVTAEASTAQFTATGGEISLHVTPDMMLQQDVGMSTNFRQGSLYVSLKSEKAVSCTYDIRFKWDEGSSYTPTKQLAEDELEFELYTSVMAMYDPLYYEMYKNNYEPGTCHLCENSAIPSDIDGDGAMNIDKVTKPVSEGGLGGLLFENEKIYIDNDSELKEVTIDYDFVANIHNLDHDQSALAGAPNAKSKSYSGKIYVDNVVC